MPYRIVFSDLDGTMLTTALTVLPGTIAAIRGLARRGIPFVPASGRSPAGIDPILRRHGLSCPIVAYGGAYVRGADGRVLHSLGFAKETACRVVRFLTESRAPCAWNVFSGDTWLTASRADPRILNEEREVWHEAREGRPEALPDGATVNKMLCICDPGTAEGIADRLRSAFPGLAFTLSSPILLEVMAPGVTKRTGMEALSRHLHIPLSEAVAFGDHYNDLEMLEAAGTPVLMGNAPAPLLARFPRHTADCDHDGILLALRALGLAD